MLARGWDEVDVVFVTGDAYVDHPSFAMALLGRLLESEGFRVAILSQPDWTNCDAWRTFGRPRLFFAVSAGNMDSMINHYTANRKVRNDDAYSPGGAIGRRPDRATLAYCQRAREAYRGVPVIAGGVEASLRRLAHYDYWSDKVRRSIILDCKADLLVYGMGERRDRRDRPAAGQPGRRCANLRDMRGVVYRLGAERDAARLAARHDHAAQLRTGVGRQAGVRRDDQDLAQRNESAQRPRLVQYHDREAWWPIRRPCRWRETEMDRVYGLPFTRRPHPSYGRQQIPAFEVVKDSVQIMRGCFGGCTFCSITAHEGRIIQSRSQESVLGEIRQMAADPDFTGVVSDIGGPTANMYQMRCTRPEVEAKCRRLSCVHPDDLQAAGHRSWPAGAVDAASRAASRASRKCWWPRAFAWTWPGAAPSTCDELATHHVGGHLKVAPEHTDPGRAGADEEAGRRGLSEVRRGVSARRRNRPARSSTSCPTSSPAIRAARSTR